MSTYFANGTFMLCSFQKLLNLDFSQSIFNLESNSPTIAPTNKGSLESIYFCRDFMSHSSFNSLQELHINGNDISGNKDEFKNYNLYSSNEKVDIGALMFSYSSFPKLKVLDFSKFNIIEYSNANVSISSGNSTGYLLGAFYKCFFPNLETLDISFDFIAIPKQYGIAIGNFASVDNVPNPAGGSGNTSYYLFDQCTFGKIKTIKMNFTNDTGTNFNLEKGTITSDTYSGYYSPLKYIFGFANFDTITNLDISGGVIYPGQDISVLPEGTTNLISIANICYIFRNK
jgi:hypothetical protein